MMPNVHAGGCSCGAIRYEIAAEPIRTFQCQCRDCQRDTGSGHASVMVFPRAAMRITGRATEISRTADTGAQKLKGFCGSCGAPLYNKPVSKPDMIGIYVGTLDDPSVFKPQIANLLTSSDLRIAGARLGSSGPGAAQIAEHAAIAVAGAENATHKPREAGGP